MAVEALPRATPQLRAKGRQVNWGLAILASLTAAAALPFVAFVIIATV